jgi:tetratricopeptide (TPR) repeat protein
MESVLQRQPNNVQARLSLAHTYRTERNYEQAIEHYKRAERINPSLADPIAGLGKCYYDVALHEMFEGGMTTVHDSGAMSFAPDARIVELLLQARACLLRAQGLMNVKHFTRESGASKEHVDLFTISHRDPAEDTMFLQMIETKLVPYFVHAGFLAEEEGRLDEAAALYGKAREISPGAFVPNYNLGNVLLALGRHAEAIGCFDAALDAKSTSPAALHNRVVAKARAGGIEPSEKDAAISFARCELERGNRSDRLGAILFLGRLDRTVFHAMMNRDSALATELSQLDFDEKG